MEIIKQLKYRMKLNFNLTESTLDDSIRLSDIKIYRVGYYSEKPFGMRLAKKLNSQTTNTNRIKLIQFNPDTKDWNIEYNEPGNQGLIENRDFTGSTEGWR